MHDDFDRIRIYVRDYIGPIFVVSRVSVQLRVLAILRAAGDGTQSARSESGFRTYILNSRYPTHRDLGTSRA